LFEEDIDAVCIWLRGSPNKGKAYLFRGDEYISYAIASTSPQTAQISATRANLKPRLFTEDIDAACVWPQGTPYEGKIYFFRGGEYLCFDSHTNRADPGYP
jgi:hypothetical protein